MVVVRECQYSRVLICKYRYYRPSYVCFLKLSEKFYYTILPNYVYPIKPRVLYCKRYDCRDYDYACPDDFECHLQDFKCRYLIHNRLCPKIPKHFCMPLPKPKFADFQPDLTYYFNFQRDESRMKCKQIR
jgi:hypothetical protein